MPVESNISKQLTEKTTKIVIIIILLNLFILPFFEISTFFTYTTPASIGFDILVDFSLALQNGSLTFPEYRTAVSFYMETQID